MKTLIGTLVLLTTLAIAQLAPPTNTPTNTGLYDQTANIQKIRQNPSLYHDKKIKLSGNVENNILVQEKQEMPLVGLSSDQNLNGEHEIIGKYDQNLDIVWVQKSHPKGQEKTLYSAIGAILALLWLIKK